MLEILGLMVAQPDPPPLPPEMGFISELKKAVSDSPHDRRIATVADLEPEKLIAEAKAICLRPDFGGIRVNPVIQRLAIKWFCRRDTIAVR